MDQVTAPPTAGALEIRDATPADAAACADVYRPYVLESVITFETEPPSV